ncbi:hypothetical protein L1O03_10775 [Corynebacterium uropygiale]|uniref:Uncharacterized protein n=1 Tax=Corynebacterium uropygiale TaxID=1775911 RepID=A0A9X1QSX9_9CORY|nr:hypothetical protein [Corynebacterium uropygiale]MCF4007645.1 hypothetical protein [Corynebacterium uropygiale]
MAEPLYIRIDLSIPGAGSVTHIAELEPLDAHTCRMKRIIETDAEGVIRGAGHEKGSRGLGQAPQAVVPHPDTYADFPDIEASPLSAADFEALWLEARARLGEF